MARAGLGQDNWNGPSDGSNNFKGGNQFERAVHLDGLTNNQMRRLIDLEGNHGVYVLYTHLNMHFGDDGGDGVRSQFMQLTGADLSPECFPAGTQVTLADGTMTPIENIRVGDQVLAFSGGTENGRGELVPKRVIRLFENMTTEWIKLTWGENELVSQNNGVLTVSTNDLGGVASYINEEGDVVNTSEGSRYTPTMLEHYSVEERDAHLKANPDVIHKLRL